MDFKLYKNPDGPDIGTAGAKVLKVDGLCFKDLSGTGELLPYEDWRLSDEERAKDLAARLSLPEIAGLMLYSPHQMVPANPHGPFPGTYGGKTFPDSGAAPGDLPGLWQRGLQGVPGHGHNHRPVPPGGPGNRAPLDAP